MPIVQPKFQVALSIDPGVTTGFTYVEVQPDRIAVTPFEKANTSVLFLSEILKKINPGHIICEDFEFRRGLEWAELFPVQLIGVVNLHVQKVKATLGAEFAPKLYMQKASMIHGAAVYYHAKEKIMEEGVYVRGIPHAMDATRHFLRWYNFGAGVKFKNHKKLELLTNE